MLALPNLIHSLSHCESIVHTILDNKSNICVKFMDHFRIFHSIPDKQLGICFKLFINYGI